MCFRCLHNSYSECERCKDTDCCFDELHENFESDSGFICDWCVERQGLPQRVRVCMSCAAEFPSGNKLFQHLRDSGHALARHPHNNLCVLRANGKGIEDIFAVMSSPRFPFLADAKTTIDTEHAVDDEHFQELTKHLQTTIEDRVRFVCERKKQIERVESEIEWMRKWVDAQQDAIRPWDEMRRVVEHLAEDQMIVIESYGCEKKSRYGAMVWSLMTDEEAQREANMRIVGIRGVLRERGTCRMEGYKFRDIAPDTFDSQDPFEMIFGDNNIERALEGLSPIAVAQVYAGVERSKNQDPSFGSDALICDAWENGELPLHECTDGDPWIGRFHLDIEILLLVAVKFGNENDPFPASLRRMITAQRDKSNKENVV